MYITHRLLFLLAGNEPQLSNIQFQHNLLRLVTHSYVLRNYHVYSIVCNFFFQFLLMEMMWTTEIQILNEEMIVAVVIAI